MVSIRLWIFVGVVALTSTDIPIETEKLIFTKQWLDLYARYGSNQSDKPTLAKHMLKTINPHVSQLRGDEEQQAEAAATFLSAFGEHPRFAGISKLFLENKNEEEENVMKTLQYVLMKAGKGAAVSKFIEDKIEPIDNEWERNIEAVKKIFKYKDGTHKIHELVEYLTNHYMEQQNKSQRQLMKNIKGLKEMLDKFRTVREYLAANNLK